MQMIAHGGKPSDKSKSISPSKEVADKFIEETPKKKRKIFSSKRSKRD